MNKTKVLWILALPLLTLMVQGQKRLLSVREIDDKFSLRWRTSEAERKNYSWKAATQVTRDGEVLQELVEEISWGSNGEQIRKVISNREAPLPSTIIVRQIAEDQKSKIIAFMTGLRSFLEKYALADDSARHAFFSKATISTPDTRGQILISGTDVFARGDKLKWWIDTRSYTITYATISTIFKGVGAEFSATYYLLPGLNYMAQARIRVPSKDMVISLKFYDFMKR